MALTAEQHATRRTGITSTDITRIVGESPWGGPCDVYRDKIDERPSERVSTIAQRMGEALEPLVCELVAEQFGIADLAPGRTVRHPSMPWVIATPDRVAPMRGVVEVKVKSVVFGGRDLWMQDDAPPPWVHVQSAWHMVATATDRCFVGALIGATPRFWVVEHDDDLAGVLLEQGEAFHVRHVLARVPPRPDGTEGARKMLAAVWPKAKAETLAASPEAEEAARIYFRTAKAIKALEAEKEQAAQDLIAYAQDFERVEGDGWRLLLPERPERAVSYTAKAYRAFDLRPMSLRPRGARRERAA